MELKGKIVKVMDVLNGNGARGTWSKQEFVIETEGQYPKKIAMSLWGEEKITKYDLEPGLVVTAKIELESREYNNRWYTEVKAHTLSWDSQQKRSWQPGGQPGAGSGTSKASAPAGREVEAHVPDNTTDDLPF